LLIILRKMKKITDLFTEKTVTALRESIAVYEGNEIFCGCLVNEQLQIYDYTVLGRGNMQAVPVAFQQAGNYNVLLHNHPSGVLKPSAADVEIAGALGNYGIGFYIVNNSVTDVNQVLPYSPPEEITPLDNQTIRSVFKNGGSLAQNADSFEERESQITMAEETAGAFNSNLVFLCEAATGTGKSLAYLVPALKWTALNKEKVIVSTNTINLQEQLAGKDIPLAIKAAGVKIKWTVVKGRSNYLCLRKFKDAAARLPEIRKESGLNDEVLSIFNKWLAHTRTGDKMELGFVPDYTLWESICSGPDTCLRSKCPQQKNCFYQRVRRNSFNADLIVVNHHILCADLAIKKEMGNFNSYALLPAFSRLIIDEAHNIEDVATSYFGKKASSSAVSRCLSLISGSAAGRKNKPAGALGIIRKKLHALCKDEIFLKRTAALLKKFKELKKEYFRKANAVYTALYFYISAGKGDESEKKIKLRFKSGFARNSEWQTGYKEQLQSLVELMEKMKSKLAQFIKTVKEQISDDQLNHCLFDLSAYVRRLSALSEVYYQSMAALQDNEIKWVEGRAGKQYYFFAANIAPLFIGKELKETVYDNLQTVVLTSATISDAAGFAYFKERSGLTLLETGRLRAKSLPYNFNYKKNCVLNFPQELPPVKDYEFIYRAADKIREAVSVFQGRIVVLCTSYRQLNILQQELENDLAQQGVTLLVQGSEPRNALIEKMRSSSHNVLLGVSSFWEGIDIRGENLSCLIMIKLPFAVPTEPLYEARVEKMIQEGRNAFFEYSVPLAVIKFKQGFGRLIRSDNDKGLFLVLDKRLLTKAYGQAFLKALPDIAYQPRESLADSAARIFRKN